MTIRHVVITGGSSGIGLATARIYRRRGYNVTVLARRIELLDQAVSELLAIETVGDAAVLALSVDVQDAGAMDRALAKAIETFGAPHLLVTSAGMAVPGYFAQIPLDVFHQTMAVNYFGTLNAVKSTYPYMRVSGGRIVMISSGAGLAGIFGYSTYSPSKFAVRGLAEALDAELRHQGIRVSIVYPPDTQTPQLEQENLTKPPETRMMAGAARCWSADEVADCIAMGVDRGKSTITPGWEMSLLSRLGSIIAPWLQEIWAAKISRSRSRS